MSPKKRNWTSTKYVTDESELCVHEHLGREMISVIAMNVYTIY